MKVGAAKLLDGTGAGSLKPSFSTKTAPKLNFKSIYDSITKQQSIPGIGFDKSLLQISNIQSALENSNVTSPKDLLLYQIQISQLNLRVELISKAADSALSMTRKLQNAQ